MSKGRVCLSPPLSRRKFTGQWKDGKQHGVGVGNPRVYSGYRWALPGLEQQMEDGVY